MYGRDTRRNQGGNYNNYGYHSGNNNRGGQTRNHVVPNEPPFTAYIGNAPDTMVQGDFEHQLFVGLKVKQVRLVRDRQTDRFRGFAYVDFEDADSLRSAIALDGTCVNDKPIRIDVASRPLGATKAEGFRNKPSFESRNGPRQLSGNNNNRSGGGFRPSGNFHGTGRMMNDVYDENAYNNDDYEQSNRSEQTSSRKNNEQQSQPPKACSPPPPPAPIRQLSDDVFIASDTPVSNDDEKQRSDENNEDGIIIARQKTRNWADCPIDDSVTDTSPPPSTNNTVASKNIDDFQIVRGRIPKSRSNQNTSSRSMGNPSMRGRTGGNYSRGVPASQLVNDERTYYDQVPSAYSNQSQSYYQYQNSQILPPQPLHMGFSYNNNNNNNNNNRHQPSAGSRQRVNSGRSNNNRNYRDDQSNRDGKRLTSTTSNSSYEITTNTVTSAENRPRLQLLPRSQKLSSPTDDNPPVDSPTARNANIFGSGKPRDERDPKLAELNKHIEEVVEKEQHIPDAKSNEAISGIIKPVRILSARSESSTDH